MQEDRTVTAFGAYRVVRLLGRGGMGEVYEVEHPQLGVHYALKAFAREAAGDDPLRARFLAEGRLLARLDHPRLVRVHDLAVDDATGRPYFVMDLVLGADGRPESLEDARRAGAVTEEQAAAWLADLRDALAYIHAAGVVHRDVKLENVLVDRDGHAVLSDFGVSRIFNRDLRAAAGLVTQTFSDAGAPRPVMGTLGYLPPEVKAGGEATAAGDLYALGVLMFRLLTGIWYEDGTDAFALLEPFELSWNETLAPLLAADPAERRLPDAGPAPVEPLSCPDWPAGMIRSSIAAFMPFVAASANGGAARGRRILSESGMAQMLDMRAPTGLPAWLTGQGLGWMASPLDGATRPNHWGGDDGVFTAVYLDPSKRRGVGVFTNMTATAESKAAVKAIAGRLLSGAAS